MQVDLPLETVHGLVLQLGQVALQSPQFLRVHLVVRLVLQEVEAFIAESERREQESLNWVAEIPVLSLLAVLVHDVPHDGKVDGVWFILLLLDEAIALVVSV